MNQLSTTASAMTLAALHQETRRRLMEAGIETPGLDARLIVEHFSGTDRADSIARPNLVVGQDDVAAIERATARRLAGEPVHRILGFREFYGLRLALSAETLEPRPDTETLVDALLPFVRETARRFGVCRILDLGTGTGAIALALLAQVETATATGVDICDDALKTAQRNAEALGFAARFATLRSDWFAKLSGRYHVIAANPPYILSVELAALQSEVRNFDPMIALDGGEDGLVAYRAIAEGAKAHLEPDGLVGLEIGHAQRHDVTEIFRQAGHRLVVARRDLAGQDRVLIFH